MNFLYKLLYEKVLLTYLEKLLSKLPLNGYKTLLGLAVLVLGAVIQLLPQYAPFLQPVIDVIAPYAELITDVGIVTLVTGAVHKVLKLLKLVKE